MAESGVTYDAQTATKIGFDAIHHSTWAGIRAPSDIAINNSGAIVKAWSRYRSSCISIAGEICDPLRPAQVRLEEMSVGAISPANEFDQSNRVAQFYQEHVIFIREGEALRRSGGGSVQTIIGGRAHLA
jgi:hypothetical protein